MSFQSLGLSKPVLEGVRAAGYETPTDIQKQAIPIALRGDNLIGLGETGSGKTAAYGLPLLDRLHGGEPGLRAVILVPTRELCVQVAENLRIYASRAGLEVRTAFGGIPIMIQEAAFRRGLDVLVACPGRLIDHIGCGNLDLSKVEVLVLDEADRMLDMGFIPQIRRILTQLPQQRQNCLFSATMPPEIERLVRDFIGEAEQVQIGKRSQAAATIVHRFEEVKADAKEPLLEKLLRKRDGRVLIFVKRKTRAEQLGRQLKRAGLPADSIHGDKSAESRHTVLKAFERGRVKHLVATDVAARGIDVSDIELVVNYEMPMAVEDYIHRVGRTGRAGGRGEALSLITRLDKRLMTQIIKHLGQSSGDSARVVVDGRQIGGKREAESRSQGRREEPRREKPRAERTRDNGRAEERAERDDTAPKSRRRRRRRGSRERAPDERRPPSREPASSSSRSKKRDDGSDVIW